MQEVKVAEEILNIFDDFKFAIILIVLFTNIMLSNVIQILDAFIYTWKYKILLIFKGRSDNSLQLNMTS